MRRVLDRRSLLRDAATLLVGTASGLSLGACTRHDPERYGEADAEALESHKRLDRERSGTSRFGVHRYRGYRGLASLPWFELDPSGRLHCVDESIPRAIDFHCHLGMSMLFAPEIDLTARAPRVQHGLDCDALDPGCELDLDIYINGNFTEDDLDRLRNQAIAQALWGSAAARTQTIPNLLDEMDATRVERAVILPIDFRLPFGNEVGARFREAIERTGSGARLIAGASVHPRDADKVERLEAIAAAGTRIVKLHPTIQGFYPDERDAFEIYEAAERLGLVIFFHGGRAGIEPTSRHRYALPRHYEGALSTFPKLPFVIGHGGARDGEAMLTMALRHQNAWLGVHGQGLAHLDEMIQRSGGERLLFGTDWPFYHLAATLAKVLIVTEDPGRSEIRHAILRGNAERLLSS